MLESFDPLARTKSLADPLRILALTLGVAAATAFVCGLALALLGQFLGWALMGVACMLCGSILLFSTTFSRPNAIYLRAFRTDRHTASLRANLIAILGPEYRLSGIRPPRKHASILLRFLLPGIFAFRYGGSKFMELEAGDDWMARLWKTYQTVRIIFIDVRDVTLYVHQEIRMTLETVGPARCVFLVDSNTKPKAEWLAVLAEIIGPEYDTTGLVLLNVNPESTDFAILSPALHAILANLPSGDAGNGHAGRQFILDHVPEETLRESDRISPVTIFTAVIALLLSQTIGLLAYRPIDSPVFNGVINLLCLIIAFPLLCILIARTFARGLRMLQAKRPWAWIRAWLSIPFAFLLLGMGGGLPKAGETLAGFHTQQQSASQDRSIEASAGPAPIDTVPPPPGGYKDIPQETQQEYAAILDMRALANAERQYFQSSQNGFACYLTLLSVVGPALKPGLYDGETDGYRFSVHHCDDPPPSLSFYIFADPTSMEAPNNRMFCLDGSYTSRRHFDIQLRYSETPSTGCTKPLPIK